MAGVTFLAFANGAPDVITAVVAGSSSSESTALIPFGSLYGAALFDMAFILAMVIQLSPTQSLTLKKREALLPLGFYIFGSLYLIAVSFFYGRMNAVIAGFFLALYPV
jgi:solute carrier family 24 (sodium/potassium/calcium exchanger), member 6